ncbi:MAG TPA: VCBS repeat-containing protein, partial [Pyrinomonadaceae bacterium]|nr:VCBS repeat-containing protein [Pyrinomonadaceae bacterium]
MIVKVTLIRRFAAHLVAVMLVLALYTLARLPEISRAERTDLATRFRFHQMPLPQFQGSPPPKSLRAVHPSLQRISGWISSVGAAVALNDMDGDGLANDLCHVDTRADQVIVAPVPGTPARYEPFALDSGRGLFDPATMAPMGCLPGDLNEDGLMDMLVYYWGRTPVAFLRTGQAASGGITLARENYLAVEVAPGGERWYTNAATLADLDGDGHLDLIIGNYFPDGARILDTHAGGREQMQHSMSRAFNGGR